MKNALLTPFLNHLPFHPGAYLGYGGAVLQQGHDADIIDLNADIYYLNRGELAGVLADMDKSPVLVDNLSLNPICQKLSKNIVADIDNIHWVEYQTVYITSPSWFPTVPTGEVLRLAFRVREHAPDMQIAFFGNSLGSWTDENKLIENGVQIRHLNDMFKESPSNEPVDYDALPVPVYENRHLYLFDMLPFRLKHGCTWRQCKFCSLARGWNAGYLERSPKKVLKEIEQLVRLYDPELFVCRDNAINGANLVEFCDGFSEFKKPWGGMARADLSDREMDALEKSGCKFIYFGLESGSDRVLKSMNKGIDSNQMSRFIKTLHGHGILTAPSLIVGAPGETEDDFQKTVDFIISHQDYLGIINLYPYISSPASDYSLMEQKPHDLTLQRLQHLTGICVALGLKVCIGEQSAEYASFRSVTGLQF